MSREARRIKEINRALAKKKARFRKVSHAFAQVKAERAALMDSINALCEEKNSLEQGQLMFHVEQPIQFKRD